MNKIQKICLALFSSVCFSSFMFGMPQLTFAETHITDDVSEDQSWTASSSPYILDNSISVWAGKNLYIEPGVIIQSNTDISPDEIPSIYSNGNIYFQGNPNSRIKVKNIWGITIDHATTTVDNTDFDIIGGLYLVESNSSIANSSVSGAEKGIYILNGSTTIDNSQIEGNSYGVWVQGPTGIFQVKRNTQYDTEYSEGARNLLALKQLAQANSSQDQNVYVNISNSSLANNLYRGVHSTFLDDSHLVQAQNNWWGSVDGPVLATSSSIFGPVDYSPWLDHDPFKNEIVKCCSSVLFIPGLEGTRLYVDQKGILGIGTSTNMLWEPNRNDDVRKLFLNSDGSSIDPTIYSGEPIGSAWGIDIYDKFMKFLDGLVAKGNMNEWRSFGYDWRKFVPDVVNGEEKKATTTVSLLNTIADLAAHSKTKKVTIIAHSNGGLVAKYLTKILNDMGKSNLIDSVISVAVPYLGTPKAILSTLHGYDESLLHGLLLKESVARQLAQNMVSGYTLMPSNKYFSNVLSPTIAFASTTIVGLNSNTYPQNIKTYDEQVDFINDNSHSRTDPAVNDTSRPIIGNKDLLASAGLFHNLLDNFIWPNKIVEWAINGWNKITPNGVLYSAKNDKDIKIQPLLTDMGDGTVVVPSAIFDANSVASLDLGSISKTENKDISHANILESSTTLSVINSILENSSSTLNNDLAVIPNVKVNQNTSTSTETFLVFSTHSPIQPHVYDSQGRHTGEIAPPAGTEDFAWAYEDNIPGSYYYRTGEDSDTYISVPDNGQKYLVVMNGTGIGSFSFDIDRQIGSTTKNLAEYVDLPVTPLTLASTTVVISTSSSDFQINQIPQLNIDVDGDGVVDMKAKPATSTDRIAFLEMIKKTCQTVLVNSNRSKELIKKIDKLEDLVKNGKLKKVNNKLAKMEQNISHKKFKVLSESDKKQIGDLIEQYLDLYQ